MWGLLFLAVVAFVPSSFCEYERVFTTYVNDTAFLETFPEDARIGCVQLASKYGYEIQEHDVVTEDGYIITVHRLPGQGKGKPLLLMHGTLDSSDTWFLRGKNSIGFQLVNEGFDVWAGNYRGNRYGRRHVTLEPDRHPRFWNYSFHEIAYYDVAAIVDYVLEKTGENQLKAVGHSLGTTIFYVLCSTRPEYNKKISILASLAPVAYMHNSVNRFVAVMDSLMVSLDKTLNVFGQHELLGDHSVAKVLLQHLCLNYLPFCIESFLLPVIGVDYQQIELDFYKILLGHIFAGSSRKTFMHLIQDSMTRSFRQYDYGAVRNLEVYGSKVPPDYDLSSVTIKVALICGKNDGLSSLKDVELLRRRLPNVVDYYIIRNDKWNHADFLWAKDIKKYLMHKLFDVLNNN